MGWFAPYVPVAKKQANAKAKLAKLLKKGEIAAPIILEGRKIVGSFWGKAWCDNLEKYSDFANRLPRGRTYVRNGSVLDLKISPGEIKALVAGSQLYRITIKIKTLETKNWSDIQKDCTGKIDSLMELLQGKLSSAIMKVVTDAERGLFPKPKEIEMDCSCPDGAYMCKHIAATLYGIGSRLDKSPELLFSLRNVDPEGLISKAAAESAVATNGDGANTLGDADLSDIFGVDLQNTMQTAVATATNIIKMPVEAAKEVIKGATAPTKPKKKSSKPPVAKPPPKIARKKSAEAKPASKKQKV